MIRRDEIKINANDKTSLHVLYSIEGTTQLVVLFPGGNSNTSRPIFYYLRDYFLRHNYDVLAISYRNLVDRNDSEEVQINKIIDYVYQAITFNHETKPYDEYIFVSKSFGNVVSNLVRNNYNMDVSKSIYVSPLPTTFIDIKKHPGLIITSSKDEYLKEEEYKELLTFSNQEIIVFEGGDHTLECDDTIETINFHKKAVQKVIDFINK